MRALIFVLLTSVFGFGAIPLVTKPIPSIDTASPPQVDYVDQNDDSIVVGLNQVIDTVNLFSDSIGAHRTNIGALIDSLNPSNNTGSDSLVRQTSPRITTPTFTSMTSGSILFAGSGGSLAQDNSNLFWDNSNKRLGIGTASPSYGLHLYQASSDIRINVQRGSYASNFEQNSSGGAISMRDASGNEDVVIRTYGITHFNGGDVGVGTTDPGGLLEVYGSGSSLLNVFNPSGNASITLGRTSGSEGYLRFFGEGSTFKIQHSTDSTTFSDQVSFDGTDVTIENNLDADSLSTGNETFTYDEGTFSFDITSSSCTDTASGTAAYTRVGKMVSVRFPSAQCTISGSDNSFAIENIPASIDPSGTGQLVRVMVSSNGANTEGWCNTNPSVQIWDCTAGSTATTSIGTDRTSITYNMN
jgi:hypothetical protein